jgi:protein-tyrosine-phosphatase
MIKTILFVCTGNTCRSAMAEGIFKKMLRERKEDNRRFNIISAGISALPGMSPTPEAISVMFEQGIDISQHKALQLQEYLVKKADLILVMSNEHKDYIQIKFPLTQNKVFLIKKYVLKNGLKNIQNNIKNYEIVDPIGKPVDFYKTIAKELKENLKKIIDRIIE